MATPIPVKLSEITPVPSPVVDTDKFPIVRSTVSGSLTTYTNYTSTIANLNTFFDTKYIKLPTNPTNGHYLTYNSSSSTWVATSPSIQQPNINILSTDLSNEVTGSITGGDGTNFKVKKLLNKPLYAPGTVIQGGSIPNVLADKNILAYDADIKTTAGAEAPGWRATNLSSMLGDLLLDVDVPDLDIVREVEVIKSGESNWSLSKKFSLAYKGVNGENVIYLDKQDKNYILYAADYLKVGSKFRFTEFCSTRGGSNMNLLGSIMGTTPFSGTSSYDNGVTITSVNLSYSLTSNVAGTASGASEPREVAQISFSTNYKLNRDVIPLSSNTRLIELKSDFSDSKINGHNKNIKVFFGNLKNYWEAATSGFNGTNVGLDSSDSATTYFNTRDDQTFQNVNEQLFRRYNSSGGLSTTTPQGRFIRNICFSTARLEDLPYQTKNDVAGVDQPTTTTSYSDTLYLSLRPIFPRGRIYAAFAVGSEQSFLVEHQGIPDYPINESAPAATSSTRNANWVNRKKVTFKSPSATPENIPINDFTFLIIGA